ncbi:winged helix-turn-helix transcriptional regulator [Streptomyces liangshanensis]|uniref:Helix-turn-helix transcriptional regulator n=1 Tax=Streptomyces liangshanensis TaxID=2717324 RepID=A0A6G9H6B0_9ACTN|nr:helix-turn-helix domain-containing protein [Streptomyces liangshanensis]QIQ06082.1 helix-turn-helix transcriptional regulator [Streptomyces liangshanensis]
MKRRDYGQYCGLARAMELVGERWALLVIRDLAAQPQRYTDLLNGLPGIPTNVLSTRLKELEQAGLVERRIAPAPQRSVQYALTPVGQDLEPAILSLGRWGASQLDEPKPGDVVTPGSVTLSLRAVFDPVAAAGLNASWEIRSPDMVLHAAVTDGQLDAGVGPLPGKPDLVITFDPDGLASYRALIQAAKCGLVELDGPRTLLDTFLSVFPLPKTNPAATKTPAAPKANAKVSH